ncbi:MAG TPA: hypothetical protein PLJ21_08410 [Pseudobdellovibrionaceae bacterium]|nr:hypothetical protein [Pseudobdellovibrionaceae bacterium]
MGYPIVDQAFGEFSEVGRIAVVVELKLRLLANKIPHLQDFALAQRIYDTESAVLPYLVGQGLISDAEKKHIESSRKIRNKIFHCEFESAVRLIEELRGNELSPGIVTAAKIDELPGDNILDKILGFANAVQSGTSTSGVFKVEKSTTQEAGIFGWLVEAMAKGVLVEGQKIANESLIVLDRVFGAMANRDIKG